jgi:hypothetical protein
MPEITLPNNGWTPRHHQMKLWQYLQAGGKRAMAVWHRRAGKDDVCLHHCAVKAIERPASYWYCAPEYAQARKAIWTAVNPHSGKRRIDEAFPHEIRSSTNESEMFLRLVNGSTVQCIGSDQYSSTVGASTAGIVFSEYALANPSAWAYYRPILEENNGWAIFITTPRGRNHAHAMFKHAQQTPSWFSELLTVEQTGMLTPAQLDETMKEMVDLYGADAGRASYRQELYCDWTASVLGAFYALEMAQVREEGRVLEVDALPDQYVHRAWDLGVTDDNVVIWFQLQGAQLIILDVYVASGVGLDSHLVAIEQRERDYGWMRGHDYVPHDAKVKEWGSGRTRVETMQQLGLHPLMVPWATLEDGRNAVRRTLPLCVFHPRCEDKLIAALELYHREWDDETKAFRASHVHDWTSHPADAFRYLSLAWRHAPLREVKVEQPRGFMIPPPAEPRGGLRL